MRIEKDPMGEMSVPDGALWGAETQRAIENFRVSGLRFGRTFLRALALVKKAGAAANMELGLLEHRIGEAVTSACDEMARGSLDDHFPVDVFQTGSGTSTNMNANEVLANRAIQLLGGQIGSHELVHPNDHVNMGQSSNDAIPTAIHVAACLSIRDKLVPALRGLQSELLKKTAAFDSVVKMGRTHLQDAAPVRLGQEFGAWAEQAAKGVERAERAVAALSEVPLGGTAVGTGLNRHPRYAAVAIAELGRFSGLALREARNSFEANAARDACVEASGELKTIAVSMSKIAGDIRWLGSGPRSGLGELRLPAVQPGSSIMPGKVNPVMAEALLMACAQAIGHDAAIAIAGLDGRFELNTMMPLIAHDLIEAIEILAAAILAFAERCVAGIEADEEKCRVSAERSLALAAALSPRIGHDAAAKVAGRAAETGKTVREAAIEMGVLPESELDALLDPLRMTRPGLAGSRPPDGGTPL